MSPAQKRTEQFVSLTGRFIRLRPRLVFPDERLARLKGRIRDLRRSGGYSREDQWYLLRIPLFLAQRSTPPTMGELSAELGIPLSSASRMADWLVRARVVERRRDPHDRRIVRLGMTEDGRELLRAGADYLKARIRRLLRRFSDREQEQLLRLMTKLIDSIEDGA